MKARVYQVSVTKTKLMLVEFFFYSYHRNELSTHSHGLLHLFDASTLGTIN